MNLKSAEGNMTHIGFAPVENSYLDSVDISSQLSSVNSCAYSCYHSTCCLSFSFNKDMERCETSNKLKKGLLRDKEAKIYKKGMGKKSAGQIGNISRLVCVTNVMYIAVGSVS